MLLVWKIRSSFKQLHRKEKSKISWWINLQEQNMNKEKQANENENERNNDARTTTGILY